MEIEREVELTCPHCGKVSTQTVYVEVEPEDYSWRD